MIVMEESNSFDETAGAMVKINAHIEESFLIVKLSGKFNIEAVPKFEEIVAPKLPQTLKAIAINFSAVEYIDSSALGSLVKLMNRVKNNGTEFLLYDMSPPIVSIFRLAYLDKFFTITMSGPLKAQYPGIKF